jgi:hypothetical protein
MNELKFYKFCQKHDYLIEGELEDNCMLFVSPIDIQLFTDFLDEAKTIDSSNVLDCCYNGDGYFVFAMKDVCDMFGLNIENFLEK